MTPRALHSESWQRFQDWRARLPHALLLTGARGLGKTDLARAFAAGLLCEAPREQGEACGACAACHWFSQGQHPDFRLLVPDVLRPDSESSDAEKPEKAEKATRGGQEITISQVRGLDEFLTVGAHRRGLRVILLYPAEALNRAAANAILKILEEPPDLVLFLLVSNEPMLLLPTLRSRCQSLPVPLPERTLALHYLEIAGVREAENWLALAGGAPEPARQLAEKTTGDWLNVLTQTLLNGRRLEVLASAADLEKTLKATKGENLLPRVMESAQKWLVDLNLAVRGLPVRFYLQERDRIVTLARETRPFLLARFYRDLLQWRRQSEHPLNIRLFLEQFLFRYRALFVR